MLLKSIFVLLMCSFVVQGTKTSVGSILKHKKSFDNWNEFYVHYFASSTSTVLATNWWELWNYYFFGQFDLPMTSYEHNNSNPTRTENNDINDVVEVNSVDNIDDDICSTCAEDLHLNEEIMSIEENYAKSEDEESDPKADENNFQLLSETSVDQSTFQINDENYHVAEEVIEDTITKSDQVVSESSSNVIIEHLYNMELNPTITNGDAETSEDITEQNSELVDNQTQDDESSFVPVKLHELRDFRISNGTQTNEHNSINNDKLKKVHFAIDPVSYSDGTERVGSIEYDETNTESREDLEGNANESETIEKIIEKMTTTDLESVLSSIDSNETNFTVNQEGSVQMSEDLNKNNDNVMKEVLDNNIGNENEENLTSTEMFNESSNTMILEDINITDNNAPIVENANEVTDESPIVENINEEKSEDNEISKQMNSNNNGNINTINVQGEIFGEILSNTENTEANFDTNQQLMEVKSLVSVNQDQSFENKEDTVLIQDTFVSETSDVNNEDEAIFSNSSEDVQEIILSPESVENDREKLAAQDYTNISQTIVQTTNLNESDEKTLTIPTEDSKNVSELSTILNDTQLIEEGIGNHASAHDYLREKLELFVPEDNMIVEQTKENVSEETINTAVTNDENLDDITGNTLNENSGDSNDNVVEKNIDIAEENSIMENDINRTILNSNTLLSEDCNATLDCSIGTESKLEDITETFEVEDSMEDPQAIGNENVEMSVKITLTKTEEKPLDQLETIHLIKTDSANNNVENSEENFNASSSEDFKMVLDESLNHETKLDSTSIIEVGDCNKTPKKNQNINQENSVESNTEDKPIDQLETSNPFEIETASDNQNGLSDTDVNLENNSQITEAEDSNHNMNQENSENLKANKNLNQENAVEPKIETKLVDQLGNSNPFKTDSTSDNQNGLSDNDVNLENNSQIIEADSNHNMNQENSENLKANETTNQENAAEPKTEDKLVDQLGNSNPFEADSTSDNPFEADSTSGNQNEVYNSNLLENNTRSLNSSNREENRFSNGTNNNIEISDQILNPAVTPFLRNTRASQAPQPPSKSGFLSHFF